MARRPGDRRTTGTVPPDRPSGTLEARKLVLNLAAKVVIDINQDAVSKGTINSRAHHFILRDALKLENENEQAAPVTTWHNVLPVFSISTEMVASRGPANS